jgi:glutamate dehydrogenase/leucine dehydrogenase
MRDLGKNYSDCQIVFVPASDVCFTQAKIEICFNVFHHVQMFLSGKGTEVGQKEQKRPLGTFGSLALDSQHLMKLGLRIEKAIARGIVRRN